VGRWGFLVIGLVVGVVFGVAATSGSNGSANVAAPGGPGQIKESAPASVASPTPEFSPTEDFSPPAIPDPAVKYSSTCDYVLGDFSENTDTGIRFIAAAELHNNGNVGAVVKVTASWKQLGKAPIVESKTAKVKYKGSTTVNFTRPSDRNELDLIQSAQDLGEICSVKAVITDTFGEAH